MSGNYQKCGHNFTLKRYSVGKDINRSINGLGNLNLINTECLIGLAPRYFVIFSFSHKLFSFVYIHIGETGWRSVRNEVCKGLAYNAEHLSLKANITIINGKEADAL